MPALSFVSFPSKGFSPSEGSFPACAGFCFAVFSSRVLRSVFASFSSFVLGALFVPDSWLSPVLSSCGLSLAVLTSFPGFSLFPLWPTPVSPLAAGAETATTSLGGPVSTGTSSSTSSGSSSSPSSPCPAPSSLYSSSSAFSFSTCSWGKILRKKRTRYELDTPDTWPSLVHVFCSKNSP